VYVREQIRSLVLFGGFQRHPIGGFPASGTPPQLWTTPLQHSVYLSNHIPSSKVESI
jgi:hypothetical protein